MVFAILGLPQLVDQELYAVWRGSEEGQTPQVAHLFSVLVVEAVGEVDVVVEEGGLGCCGGDDWDLVLSVLSILGL